MFKNFIKIALRNLFNNKIFTFINITGLVVGITCFLLIALFVNHELGYDSFHENAENIYRVNLRYDIGVNKFDEALGPVPLAEAMKSDFPEVIHSTRLYHTNYRGWIVYVKYGDKQFREEKFLFADSTVFDVFTIPLIEGDPKKVLLKPNSVIITPEIAVKYFGDDDPLGKIIKTQDGILFTVTGLSPGMPAESHFQFDLLASFATLPKSRDPEWYDTAVYTYVLLQPGYPWKQLDEKLPGFSKKYVEPVLQGVMGIPYDQFLAEGNYFGFFMEPLLDLHLHSDIPSLLNAKGNLDTVYIFSVIGFAILIIACINFVNLSTSRSMQRANEVGIRKVVGSGKLQLITQFLTESVMLVAVAVSLSAILVELLLPQFNSIINRVIEFNILKTWHYLPLSVLFIIFVGGLSGLYPAFLLSSFKPVAILKGMSISDAKGSDFKNMLVVFQFTATIVLFIGTMVIYNQLVFMQNKKLGYDKEQVIVINNAHKLGTRQKAFKDRINNYTNIVSSSYSDCLPQILLETKIFEKEGGLTNESHTLVTMMADMDINKTYGLRMAEGRFFDEKFPTDSFAVVLNEAAVNSLEIDNIQDTRLTLVGRTKTPLNVVGVLKDFHLESLHFKIRPFAALVKRKRPGVYLSVRFDMGSIGETLAYLEDQWDEFAPGQPFEYIFYDDKIEEAYKDETQTGRLISVFAAITIIVACLGLLGLISHTTLRKTKEIGIRKIMGSSGSAIVLLLIKDLMKWVIIANLAAWPLAYYLMDNWLQNFVYRVDISYWVFIIAGVTSLVIAIITVSSHAIKASLANPVDSLRDE